MYFEAKITMIPTLFKTKLSNYTSTSGASVKTSRIKNEEESTRKQKHHANSHPWPLKSRSSNDQKYTISAATVKIFNHRKLKADPHRAEVKNHTVAGTAAVCRAEALLL